MFYSAKSLTSTANNSCHKILLVCVRTHVMWAIFNTVVFTTEAIQKNIKKSVKISQSYSKIQTPTFFVDHKVVGKLQFLPS